MDLGNEILKFKWITNSVTVVILSTNEVILDETRIIIDLWWIHNLDLQCKFRPNNIRNVDTLDLDMDLDLSVTKEEMRTIVLLKLCIFVVADDIKLYLALEIDIHYRSTVYAYMIDLVESEVRSLDLGLIESERF